MRCLSCYYLARFWMVMQQAGSRLVLLARDFASHENKRTHQPPARFDRKGIPSRDYEAAQLPIDLRRTTLSQ